MEFGVLEKRGMASGGSSGSRRDGRDGLGGSHAHSSGPTGRRPNATWKTASLVIKIVAEDCLEPGSTSSCEQVTGRQPSVAGLACVRSRW